MEDWGLFLVGILVGSFLTIVLIGSAGAIKNDTETKVVFGKNPPGYRVECRRTATYVEGVDPSEALVKLECDWVATTAPAK